MADDGYITIHRTTDVAQGELMAEMLRREGIEARFHRVSSTMIGLPALLFEMTVDVPAESAARARELLGDLEYAGAAEAAEQQQGGGEDGAANGPAPSGRRPMLAAGFAVFLPGGAHLYARRPWTALVLALGIVACLAVGVIARGALPFGIPFAVLVAIVICDAVGGVSAARAEGRGELQVRRRQVVRGLRLLAAALVVGAGGRLAAAAPGMWRGWQLSKFRVSCTNGAIFVENRGSETREVEISKLRVVEEYGFFGRRIYDVGIAGPRFVSIAPGSRGTVTPRVGARLGNRCNLKATPDVDQFTELLGDPSLISDIIPEGAVRCGFRFSFAARAAGVTNAEPLEGVGSCRPSDAAVNDAAGRLVLPAERS